LKHLQIYVDADACPVKEEAARVAARHNLIIHYVSNSHMRLPFGDNVNRVVVSDGPDAADNWILEEAQAGDVVITADTPLASRAIKKGVKVIAYNGKPFSEDSIGMALAMRDLMSQLRETGDVRGNNPVFTPSDRSRFLQGLENTIQALKRTG
jgi:uncharacterized protein YaiI (UPF0178 family)